MSLFDFTQIHVFVFALAFFRIGAFLFLAPVIGSDNIPNQVKIGFALILAFLLMPTFPLQKIPFPPASIGVMFIGALFEVGVGLLLGFIARVPFAAIQTAGAFVGREMGLALANVLDPISNQQVAILGQFKVLLAFVIWVAMNGHLALIDALGKSFDVLLPMTFSFNHEFFRTLPGDLGSYLFEFAIKADAPAMVALFLTTVALGFMAKTVPEMNVFILGFALRIGVGFFVILVSIPLMSFIVRRAHEDILHYLDAFLGVVG